MNAEISEKVQERSSSASAALLKEFLMLLLKIAVVLLSLFVLFTVVFGVHRNLDPAMAPAIKDGDLVIFYRLDKQYVFGDTVALQYQGKTQVRRVVAVAGDTVDMVEGQLLINGSRQQEMNIYEATYRYENDLEFPLTLSEDEVFVLGDARENATDSRVYGPIATSDTLGKVMTLLRRRGI